MSAVTAATAMIAVTRPARDDRLGGARAHRVRSPRASCQYLDSDVLLATACFIAAAHNQSVSWPRATLPAVGSLAVVGARIVPWRQLAIGNHNERF